MKDLLVSIFGNYVPVTSPIVVDIGGVSSVVDSVPNGFAGVDWVWISGVFIFAILLYCFLRMVGGILTK